MFKNISIIVAVLSALVMGFPRMTHSQTCGGGNAGKVYYGSYRTNCTPANCDPNKDSPCSCTQSCPADHGGQVVEFCSDYTNNCTACASLNNDKAAFDCTSGTCTWNGSTASCGLCYTGWQNVACGGGSCLSTSMQQRNVASGITGVCATQYRCSANHPSCVPPTPTDPKPTPTKKPSPTPTRRPSPTPFYNPIGNHDLSDCTRSAGWTCDQDDFTAPLTVHFYEGATFLGSTVANTTREAAVGAACGGNANHGFSFTTPDTLKDGVAHSITAYAINIGTGTGNPVLGSSPRSITCAAPTPTPTNVPAPAAYFKVKGASFYKLGPLSSTVPATATAYDASDTAPYTVFNQGTSGIVAAQEHISVAPGTVSSSGWSRANQTIPSTFNAAAFKSYVMTKKSATTITDLSQITAAGTYYYNGDLTISADIAQNNVVLVVNGNVTINGSGAPVKFNGANRPFALVVSGSPAKTLTFSDALTEADGLYIADDVQFSTNESFPSSTPLKIVGNISSASQVSVIRARSASPTAPSLFIVFDPTQYVGLLDKLSVVKSSWTQIQ